MSVARECDRCGSLFKSEPGCIEVETMNVHCPDGSQCGWSEIDLCVDCSRPIIETLRPALLNLPEGL